jgi:hypothetical protein
VEQGLPFQFEMPVSFFEKAEAPAGRQKRIGGLISTETEDRHREVVLQKGLDLGDFVQSGWFNDNHSKDTTGIVGYPEQTTLIKKGEPLPDGTLAKATGTWAEGYLLDTRRASDIWELGQALQKSGRRLGFSVEGSVLKRMGKDRKVIAKAKVRNVAITNCPVNTDTRLEVLAKSLVAVERAEQDPLVRAVTMGTATAPSPETKPMGPRTGEGVGKVLAEEHLETDERCSPGDKDEKSCSARSSDSATRKSLTDTEAIAWVRQRLPHLSLSTACRLVDVTRRLKRSQAL